MALNKETQFIHGHPVWNATSLEDFEEWVDSVKDRTETTIFRGQRKDYNLLPNISRNDNAGNLLVQERALLARFKKEAPRCLQIVPRNDWEWLVVAQHHGLYTRLLDWTYDPYVALWFALEKAAKKDSRPEVWVMNPLADDVIDSFEHSRPFSGKRTKIFKPSFDIPRVRAQKGCFTLFKYVEKSEKGFVPLERNKYLRRRFERVRIAKRVATTIIAQLKAMDYTRSIMYPDIDEVARRVQSKVLGG